MDRNSFTQRTGAGWHFGARQAAPPNIDPAFSVPIEQGDVMNVDDDEWEYEYSTTDTEV